MAKYRKLGRTSSQRKALLRNQVTALINNGRIVTTQAKAKEVQKIAEGLIALAVKEKDNFEMVTVSAKVPVKDKDGKRVKEVVDGKKVTKFETVEKEIKKDLPSRLHARRQMPKVNRYNKSSLANSLCRAWSLATNFDARECASLQNIPNVNLEYKKGRKISLTTFHFV